MPRQPSSFPAIFGILACAGLLATLVLLSPTHSLGPPTDAPLQTPQPVLGKKSRESLSASNVGISPDVAAHQGVAAMESETSDYWIFDTDSIQRFSWSWSKMAENAAPFSIAGTSALLAGFSDERHLGTGAVHDGLLYLPAENWPSVTNQHILVFDAQTLMLERAIPTNQLHEMAAVAVVPDEPPHGAIYVASYLDSSQLFKYDLSSLAYLGSLRLSPAPPLGIQGLAYHYGMLFVATTGGSRNVGHLYSVERATGRTRLMLTSTEPGTHEGIAWRGSRLMWLIDRHEAGSRVHFMQVERLLP